MPMAVGFVAKLALKHAQERTRKGIKIYSSMSDVEIVSQEELPVEFGGSAPMQPIIDEWHKKINANRDFLMSFQGMKINEKFYKPEVISCEVKTLTHSIENPNANYLVEYDESI